MKPWSEVTERERGWIEGVFAAGQREGRKGKMRSLCVSRSLPDTPMRLLALLGGQVKHRLKKNAYTYHAERASGESTHVYDEAYCFEWKAGGSDFSAVIDRLKDLDIIWWRGDYSH